MGDLLTLFSFPDTWISLLSLTVMEIVLGIDNIIFIAIIVGKLPKVQQGKARTIGLLLALVFRIGLLFAISWLATLTAPLFHVMGQDVSGRDLILLMGGLFLLAKATVEIHNKFENEDEKANSSVGSTFVAVIFQIIVLDVVFSIDSIITAIGLVQQVSIMIIAVLLSLGVMLIFSESVSNFIHHHPTMKILALSFLMMIGMLLVAEGFKFHVPKGYVYFAMAFSFAVEMLNIRLRDKKVSSAK
ncbi:MAG: TerC family protein [Chloroherpetonaceae bacterium]|nr:TerC family protein [Chloroherpetonaceae bacterium]